MIKQFTIKSPAGLHARPASLLVSEASKYENEISIIFNQKKYTLKSILMIMSLSLKQNDSFKLEVNGNNQKDILNKLEEILVENGVV